MAQPASGPCCPLTTTPYLPTLMANGVLQSSFCAIWQIVATHVGFVLFGKISQIRVTFATIFHNGDKSLITFVLFRVISPIHVYFSAIFSNSSKKLDRFCAIL